MNEAITRLQPYPFEKLASLRANLRPALEKTAIDLSLGEPKHATPAFIMAAIGSHLADLAKYPTTRGTEALRMAIVAWLYRRYSLPAGSITASAHVLPVNGTREALFAIAQCLIDQHRRQPLVIMPNPFYQIYEGAALLAGAQPYFVNCLEEQEFLPDFSTVPEAAWMDCQLLYLCTPGNPTGAIADLAMFAKLFELADRYDFVIASDECYSELYLDEASPPLGLLEAAARLGRSDYHRCLVFHSLSKRSSVPGLRSGFVAGDAQIIDQFFRYRTYHGCAMPLYAQAASIAAWQDEAHVRENRVLYRQKFAAMQDILGDVLPMYQPPAGFYLWPKLAVADTVFTQGLLEDQNVTVLPGSFLARTQDGVNPGQNRVRMALVAPVEDCIAAAHRIREFVIKRCQ